MPWGKHGCSNFLQRAPHTPSKGSYPHSLSLSGWPWFITPVLWMTRLVSLQDTPQPPGVSPSQPLQSVPSPVSGSEQVNSPGEKSPQLFHHLDSTSVSLQPGLITRTLFFFFFAESKGFIFAFPREGKGWCGGMHLSGGVRALGFYWVWGGWRAGCFSWAIACFNVVCACRV